MTLRSFWVFYIILSIDLSAQQFEINKIFDNNMVLQRHTDVSLWGKTKPGTKLNIFTSWNNKKYSGISDKNGKWKIPITTDSTGGPYLIKISSKDYTVILKNILLGEVWLCTGQSNMEMPLRGFMGQSVKGGNREISLASKYKNIRLFQAKQAISDLPADELSIWHSWSEVSSKSISDFSAVGWFFGKLLNDALNDVPIGLIQIDWGGTPAELWMSKKAMSKFPEISQDSILVTSSHYGPLKPSRIFNAMIHPVSNLKFKGVLWYQGESNVKRQENYEQIFSGLIKDWREQFSFNFPFYFVQIAPYYYYNKNSAVLREAQLKTMQTVKNTGMVVSLDVGEQYKIHPGKKKEIGERLAYWALAKDYGFNGLSYKAPEYKNLMIKDSLAFVYFDSKELAESSVDQLKECFEIAGDNRVFYPANAQVKESKDYVEVWSSKVKKPVAVRYCFKNWCIGKLYGTNELPVSSFRTDDWNLEK